VNKAVIPVIIILAVGVPTAYGITITLGGDPVIINGILDLMGNRITNVGTPTAPTDSATKAYVDSAPGTDTLALLGCTSGEAVQFVGSVWTCANLTYTDEDAITAVGPHTSDTLAGLSCAANEIPKFVGSTWICAVDIDTTFSGTDFATSNQACPGGQKATGVDASGIVTCAADIDTTFSGADFATSNQACPGGQKVTGVDATGSVTCAVDIDTDTVPWNSRVPQSTSLTAVDSTADIVGQDTSITIGTDGFPVISYRDFTNSALKVAHCTNASCSAFDTPTAVDSADDVGEHTSITIGTDGFPVISYYDTTNDDLKVAHCTSVDCSTFDTPVTVDNSANVGEYTSITIGTDGLPVISYRDGSTNDLKVAHCENASCSSGSPTLTTVDSSLSPGLYTSITIGTDGLPVISYHDSVSQALKVAHCTNASCSSGSPTITIVDNAANVGWFTSITIGTDGFPVVSYIDATNQNLKVAHCTNTSCSTSTTTIVDSASAFQFSTSITIGTDGFPVVSYDDITNNDLKVVHCTNVSCSTFDTPVIVDNAVFVGIDNSITIGTDGLPVISYRDVSTQDLMVAKCTNPYCLNNWIRR